MHLSVRLSECERAQSVKAGVWQEQTQKNAEVHEWTANVLHLEVIR